MIHAAGLDADVLIAGAGPAGAAAATSLARAGLDVILVDRARFPRDKVCGDFVGPVALAELHALGIDFFSSPLRGNTVDRAALFSDGRELITYVLPKFETFPAFARVIPRVVLDDAIVRVATRAGARLEQGTVVGFRLLDRAVSVSVREGAEARAMRVRVLIGADGAGSQVGRVLRGIPRRDELLVAARAYFTGVARSAGRCDLSFTSGSFPGYAWIFPTSERVANVGVGMVVETFPATQPRMHELLARLVRDDPALSQRLAGAEMIAEPVGWALPTYSGRSAVVGERVILIGDAAGLVNP
ncbi:MAG: geranylgeranyl reductase family protein, partial [Candidatus Eremiobacteraeota bacterium]|nr:geranylgeranyl reductase family protein [Candidatus Eremiobacteraeota bacterium]